MLVCLLQKPSEMKCQILSFYAVFVALSVLSVELILADDSSEKIETITTIDTDPKIALVQSITAWVPTPTRKRCPDSQVFHRQRCLTLVRTKET